MRAPSVQGSKRTGSLGPLAHGSLTSWSDVSRTRLAHRSTCRARAQNEMRLVPATCPPNAATARPEARPGRTRHLSILQQRRVHRLRFPPRCGLGALAAEPQHAEVPHPSPQPYPPSNPNLSHGRCVHQPVQPRCAPPAPTPHVASMDSESPCARHTRTPQSVAHAQSAERGTRAIRGGDATDRSAMNEAAAYRMTTGAA